MARNRRRWIMRGVAASTSIAVLVGASYVHDHPASLISYALASTGFKLLEPTFTDRRKGVVLFDRLQSYQSLAEVFADERLEEEEFAWIMRYS